MASVVDLARKKKYKWKDEENQQNYQRKQQENLEKTGSAGEQVAKTAQRVATKAQEKSTTGQGTTLPRAIGTQKTYQGYYEQKTNSREAAKASDTLARMRSMREYRQNLSQRIYSPNDYDQKQIAAKGVDAWQKDIQSQLATLDSRILGMEQENKQAQEEAKKQRENFLSAGYKTATGQTARQQSLLKDQQARQQSMEKVRTEIQNRINYPTKTDLEEIDRVGMNAWKAEMQKDLDYLTQALEKNKQTQQEAGGGDYAAIQRAKRQELEDVLLAPDARQTIGQAGAKSGNTLGSILDGTFDMRRAARYLTDPEFASKAVQGTDGKVGEDLDFLTEDEKNTLLYYAGKGDWKAMKQYYSVIERELEQRRQEETNRQTADWANENKVLGVAANIGGNLASPLALLETGGQAIKNAITGENEPVNTASPLMAGAQLQKATQEGITRDMGATGQFLTNTGLSIGQNLVRLPLGPAAALGSMAASAGGQTALDTAERGGSAGKALSLGLLSGAAEALTEKLPLDNIFRLAKEGAGGLKNAVKAVLRQAGTEAGEETVSEIANTLADNIIMADQSQMEETIRQMMNQQGMSEQEARRAATLQYFVQNPALAAAGGALSGGIFGAGAQAYNALSPTQRSYRKLQKAAEQLKKAEQEETEYDQWKQEWAARDAETLAQREAAAQTAQTMEGQEAQGQEEELVPFDFEESPALPNGPEMQTPTPLPVPTAKNAVQTAMPQQNRIKRANDQEIERARKTAERLGAKFEVQDIGKASGKYENGTITINPYATNPVQQVLVHELTHHLETSGQYDTLRDRIFTFLSDEMKVDVQALQQAVIQDYAQNGVQLDAEGASRELVAKFCESRLFQDEKSIERLAQTDRNIFQRIYDWIRNTVKKLQGTPEERSMLKIQSLYEKAAQTIGQQEGYGEPQYIFSEELNENVVLRKDKDGKTYVNIPVQKWGDMNSNELLKILSEVVRTKFNDWVEVHGQKIGINQKTAKEWVRSKDAQKLYFGKKAAYIDKINAFIESDNLLRASRNYVGEALKHDRKDKFKEFARGTVRFKVGENGYEADIIVGTTKNNVAILYDIVGLKPIKIAEAPLVTLAVHDTADHRFGTSANNSISNVSANINNEKLGQKSLGASFDELMEYANRGTGQQVQQLNPLFSIDANGRQVVSPKGVQTIQELGQKLGKTVTWTEDENFNGSYDPKTGEIKISKYTKNPALFVFKHELTHSLEGTDAYRDLQKHIMQSPELMTFAKSLGGNVSMLARAKQKSYQAAGQDIDLDQAMREVVADYVGSNLFTDEKSIRSLAKAKPNVAQRILGWLQRTYKKVRGQWGTEEKWLYQAEQLYRRAIQQSKKAPATGEATEELSIGQEFFDEYKTLLEQYGPELRQEDNAPASEQPSPAMSKKGKKFMEGNEKKTAEKIAQAMDIPKQAKKDRLLPAIRKMTEEIGETGKISRETADAAFEEAYRSGLVVLDDFYKTYKGLRDELRTTRLQISEKDRADITDFEDFRKSNMGRLRIVNENGIPVDTKYQELRQRYPELFPEDITHPGAQLEAIADVRNKIEKNQLSLDQYYGPDADRFKAYARNEFDKALDFLKEGAGYVKRYEDDRLEARRPVKLEESTLEEVRAAYEQDKKLQRAADRATAKNLLTNFDKRQVDRLLAGDIMPDELPRGTNRQGVMEVYEAKKAQQDNMKTVRQYRAQLKESRMQRGLDLIEGADRWKDKNVGFNYSRETAERNMRDIMSRGEAENMIAAYFRPVHKAQADSIRYQNSLRDQVRELNISTKPKYQIQYQDPNQGNMMVDAKVSESALVQLLGEGIISQNQVNQAGADGAKLQKAVDTMRTIYNRLFEDINNTLMRNGYTPMESRKDYFPHFTDQGGGTFVEKAMNFLGLGKVDELPTDIAGMTHTFRPGKKWFGNMLRRKGGATDYDAIKGFDRYLNGAADVIYQTDNIQNLRTLENAIRYKYSDKGTKEEIEALRERRDIGEDSKELMIQGLLERDAQHLPQFVTWLRNYTDILAGKKHPSDRSAEHEWGRGLYTVSKKLEGRIAANMVAISPGSWLTNFVPLTQAKGQVSMGNLIRAMYDTVRSNAVSDGFAEASTFLTNRRGADPIYKSGIEKATDFLTKPMYYIDNFTAGAITRAKYYENLQNGMSEEAALEQADEWAAGLMGDRSKGAVPTLFEKKNPIAKSLTMFQLEVNNQLSFLMKDIPREEREKGALILGAKLLEIFIGAKLFDDALEKIAGRRAALDPLEIINDLTGDITGKKLNNVFDILGGEGFLEETEAKNPSKVAANLWSNLADQTPFIGGLIGGEGGRLPVASALPDFGELGKLLDGDVSGEKKKQILKDELLWKTGMYLLPPAGGTQFKRVRDAYNLLKQRGNYKLNDKGEKQLRYLAERDMGTALKAGFFGQYATKEGVEYIDKGFPMLSVKKTQIVDDAESQGIDRYLAKEIMDDASGFEKSWDFRRYLLERDDLTPEQKKWIDKNLFDNSKVWERIDYSGDEALMEMTGKSEATNERVIEAINADIDAAIYRRAYEAQKGIESDKDASGETIPLSRDKKRKEAVEEAVGDELSREKLKKLYDILDISKKA